MGQSQVGTILAISFQAVGLGHMPRPLIVSSTASTCRFLHVYVPLMHMLAFLMCLKADLGGLTDYYLNTCLLKQAVQHHNVGNPLLFEELLYCYISQQIHSLYSLEASSAALHNWKHCKS